MQVWSPRAETLSRLIVYWLLGGLLQPARYLKDVRMRAGDTLVRRSPA